MWLNFVDECIKWILLEEFAIMQMLLLWEILWFLLHFNGVGGSSIEQVIIDVYKHGSL